MQNQDFKIYSGPMFLHQNEQKEKWENGLLKPLFVQVAGKAHWGAMSSTRGNIVFSLPEKERNISYNKTRGHERQFDPFSKWHRMFPAGKQGVMSGPLKSFDESDNL